MIRELNHVGLSVANLDRAMEFYRNLFGMDIVIQAPFSGERYEAITGLPGVKGRAALLELRGTSLSIELFEFECPKPAVLDPRRPVSDHGISHFCIGVTDIESEYERLKAAGVFFHSRPISSKISKAVYARDPDGNVFELRESIATSR